MEQRFVYEKTEQGLRILRCYGTSGCVEIPKILEGQPVTELASYLFADTQGEETAGSGTEDHMEYPCICGTQLEELHLPDSIRRIGRYAFYNCLKFRKLVFSSNLAFMGAGVFTGCQGIRELEMQEIPTEKSCLREILSDLKQAVSVKAFQENGLQYWLEYPEFFEEAVENTPARIIDTHTHGMGIQYRNAFRDTRVVFSEYDGLFLAGKYNMDRTSAVRLAAFRLFCPFRLEEKARAAYREFLEEHREEMGKLFLENEEGELLRWMAESFLTTREQAEELVETAGRMEKSAAVSMLMDIRHRRFPERKRTFSL